MKTFSEALTLIKLGHKVSRSGWNGKGMFIFYIQPGRINHPNFDGLADPYIAMKTVQTTLVPWLASQTDILAEDWDIVK